MNNLKKSYVLELDEDSFILLLLCVRESSLEAHDKIMLSEIFNYDLVPRVKELELRFKGLSSV